MLLSTQRTTARHYLSSRPSYSLFVSSIHSSRRYSCDNRGLFGTPHFGNTIAPTPRCVNPSVVLPLLRRGHTFWQSLSSSVSVVTHFTRRGFHYSSARDSDEATKPLFSTTTTPLSSSPANTMASTTSKTNVVGDKTHTATGATTVANGTSSKPSPTPSSGNTNRRTRLLYVAVALSEIDHVTFHQLKFQQLCQVTRAGAPKPHPPPADLASASPTTESADNNKEEDYVDFQMLAFSKEGVFVTQWIHDDDRLVYQLASPIVIPHIERVPFEQPVFVDEEGEVIGAGTDTNAEDGDVQQQIGEGKNNEEGEGLTSTAGAAAAGANASSSSSSSLPQVSTSLNNGGSSSSHHSPSEHIRPDNTIIEGRRDEAKRSTFCLVRVSDVCAFDLERMRHFLQQNMLKEDEDDSGESLNQLIFGAHGYGFALGVNVRVVRGDDDTAMVDRCEEDNGYYVSISLVDLMHILEGMRFRSICFDCCLMSTAQNAASMYKVTSHVVACEGYMWEEDNDIEKHVLNSHSARYLCFGVEGDEETFAGHDLVEVVGENTTTGGKVAVSVTGSSVMGGGSGGDEGAHDVEPLAGIQQTTTEDSGKSTPTRGGSTVGTTALLKRGSVDSTTATATGTAAGGAAARTASLLSPLHSPTAEDTQPTMPLTKALVEGNKRHDVLPELIAVSRHFASNSPRGDVAVLNTEAGTLLYHHLLLSKPQLVPFLHRPASLTTKRPLALDIIGPQVRQCAPLDARDPEVGSFLYDVSTILDAVWEYVGEKGSTKLDQKWIDKAYELLSATVVFNLPPREEEAKYYTCTALKGLSVKI